MDKKNQSKVKPEIVKEVKPVEVKETVVEKVVELSDEELMIKYAGCNPFPLQVNQPLEFVTYKGITYPLPTGGSVYLFNRNPEEFIRYMGLCQRGK